MIYPDNFEDKIKFAKVRQLVANKCLSDLGAELVSQMSFSDNYDTVTTSLCETDEFRQILIDEDSFPTVSFTDLRNSLSRIRIEGLYLEESELSSLSVSMKAMRDIVRFFSAHDADNKYEHLKMRAGNVAVFPVLTERIESILDKYGKIRDNASSELSTIRREILSKQSTVSKRLAAILRQAQNEGLVDSDAVVSLRDGRAVIPVPAANKRKINGIVLDESATGRTSFIEPAEVVAINNELRELGYAERREIIKILVGMSDTIRPYIDDILSSYEFLGFIDFVRAKAKFAIDTESIKPIVENRRDMYWQIARHPLLFLQLKAAGKPIVPLDIELCEPLQRILLISGPNAGGKSVCLQTVGLLQYMMQCGMLVPMADGSKMGLFQNIFIDMGDEQSIENDLSTYSSHLTNMKHFIRHSNNSTLLLIDEFGTGTEPMLGGAIAESVLSELNKRGAFGVITTHYTGLKHFAAQTDGIHNGAMLFDTHAIQPMFKLQMGQPGSSFAFEIARKIGLPESILQDAKEKMGQDHLDFDKHLREIVRDKRYWEMKRQSVKDADKKLNDTLSQYQIELQNIKRERKLIIERAKIEAQQMIDEANKRIELTIKQIKESQAEKSATKQVRDELTKFKEAAIKNSADNDALIDKKIERIREREERKKQRQKEQNSVAIKENAVDNSPMAVGDMVRIDGKNGHIGEIIELFSKEATVAVGNLQSRIKLSRLEKLSSGAAKRERKSAVVIVASNVGDAVREKKLNFKPEIDVRGMRGDEAIETIANFVDEAVICEQSTLHILHGKGNGILRQMIRQYLHTLPYVDTVRDEHVQFGGAGITVVELK